MPDLSHRPLQHGGLLVLDSRATMSTLELAGILCDPRYKPQPAPRRAWWKR